MIRTLVNVLILAGLVLALTMVIAEALNVRETEEDELT